jgi:hypothetical protein
MRERKKLGEILTDLEVLTPHEVDRVVTLLTRCKDRQKKFGQMARDLGLLDEQHILAALAVQMELFPGIEELTLEEVLESLLEADHVSD